jgi:FixJ family two-component response regulator
VCPDKPSDALVFIVDDDASVRRSVTRLLGTAGYATEAYGAPEEFLKRPPHDGPSCLVLDLQMPGMDGLELQAKLMESGHLLPIVFVTGHGDIPSTVRAMRQGALDFLSKPFTAAQLIGAIEAALARDLAELGERRATQLVIHRYHLLTAREREVCAHVVRGLLNKQIARRLGTSEKTIKAQRGRVMAKMEAGSVAELVHMIDRVGAPLGSANPAHEPPVSPRPGPR